ncbi:MAG: hypothetical protein RL123_2000 [Pseudomonadota bacterium]
MMRGHRAIWSYAWDLHDIGLDAALGRVADAGLDTVSLATSYHAGRFLQPGNPRRRVWFPQDGTVYYRADPARWRGAEIAPLVADIVATEGDMLAALIDRRARGGPAVSCWTVCLHNTRLGLAHPDHVVRTAHGDPAYYGLCPSSPAARAYAAGLVAEISEVYAPDRIEIETLDFMGFDHGFHHEKDGLGLLPEDRFLLGLCFCPHCVAAATADGIDAEGARAEVARLLDAAFARELPAPAFPDFPARGIEAFAGHEALHAFLAWRPRVLAGLAAELRAACRAPTRLTLIDFAGSWWGGVDLGLIAPHVDGVIWCAYTAPPAQIAAELAALRGLIGPGAALSLGLQLFHPTVADAADFAARVAAAEGVADGLNVYNLGLVPPARLGWVRAALAAGLRPAPDRA